MGILLCAFCTTAQETNSFFVTIKYDYKKLDSVSTMQQQFLPKEAIVWGNDTVMYQRLKMGMFEVLRRATPNSDSIDHYINIFGNKILYREVYEMDSVNTFDFKYTEKTNKVDGKPLPMAIGLYKNRKFPVFYIPNQGNQFFPRFKKLKGMPVQYKLEGIQEGMDVLVYAKQYQEAIPEEYSLATPEGYNLKTRTEVRDMFGFFSE